MENSLQPKISVLVAIYNAERYLRQCLDSLRNQTLHDIQIVCIDDCSTDNSLAIVNEYAAHDARFVVLKTPQNSGQAVARNLGLTAVTGQYTTMLDSDDWYAPDALEQAYVALQQAEDVDCVLMNLVFYDEATKHETPYPLRTSKQTFTGEEAFRLSINAWGIHGLYVLRTELHKQYPYDTTCRLYSDDNTTHIHYLHARKVVICNGRYYYRQHGTSTTQSTNFKRFDLMEANLSMYRQLEVEAENGSFSHKDEVLQHFETLRWCNLIGLYGFLLQNKRRFTNTECVAALNRMQSVLKTIHRDQIDWRVKYRLGYWPWHSFKLFCLQSWVYFQMRWLKEKVCKRKTSL